MRFVYVLYLSSPKIIDLKSIFALTDDETKSEKGEHVLAILKSNNLLAKIFNSYFLLFLESFLKKGKGEKWRQFETIQK